MPDLRTLSYEEVCIFLCLLCVRVVRLKGGWEIVRRLDFETRIDLLSEDGVCSILTGGCP
jgi:hypothetical protein